MSDPTFLDADTQAQIEMTARCNRLLNECRDAFYAPLSPITEDFSDPCQKITLDLTKPITIEFSGRISHSPPITTLRTPDLDLLGDPEE